MAPVWRPPAIFGEGRRAGVGLGGTRRRRKRTCPRRRCDAVRRGRICPEGTSIADASTWPTVPVVACSTSARTTCWDQEPRLLVDLALVGVRAAADQVVERDRAAETAGLERGVGQ